MRSHLKVPRVGQHIHHVRFASTAPVKSYWGLRNPASLFWHQKLSPTAKYFSGILAAATAVSHVHPNVLVTVGPPVAVAGYFIARRLNYLHYKASLALVRPADASAWADEDAIVRVWSYKEEDLATAMRGIENRFGHFQAQVVELVEKRVVDYVAAQEQSGVSTGIARSLVDENSQVVVHMGSSFETFVTSQAKVIDQGGNDAVVEYIKCSVPYYSSKNAALRRRLGVAEVSMLAVPDGSESEDYTDYRIHIDLCPYRFFGKPEGFSSLSSCGIMSSSTHKPAAQKTSEPNEH
ncbi:hypothetical protein A9F13_16g01397 [Clavispora lusitaniae]|nr:hypothetical protein A9F13_16g01397 [Clavispora lusitaniae]